MSNSKKIKKFKDKKTGHVWNYISIEYMNQTFPKGGYSIIGEVDCKKIVQNGKEIELDTHTKAMLAIQENGYYKKKYFIDGYLPTLSENEFVVVKKKRLHVFPFIVLLLLAFMALGGWFLWVRNQGPDIDPSIKDYVSSLQRPANLDDTQIAIPGFGTWKMVADTDVIEAELYNPKDNPCYFKYTILLSESNKVVYQSKLIPPGKGIQNLKLNQVMKEGKYPLTIKIETYDLVDYETSLNGANMNATLQVIK